MDALSAKPLQLNPIKLSQPMGAMLCFLGIKNCMPLMHGAQGCASFSKVFFTRHFNDPIAVQTTAVNDITAVLDGGDYAISESIKNITKKVKPDLIGLFTTGLTETKGDDIKGATLLLKDIQKMVYVNTPDFEGSLESGFAKSVEAIITQLVNKTSYIDNNKALIIPNVNLKPIEVEKIKDTISLFGYEVYSLPDLSDSLDGHLGEKQGALTSGGINVEEIKNLALSSLVITIGNSVKKAGELMLKKNENINLLHFDSLCGLQRTDDFYKKLCSIKEITTPHPSIVRWRKRLQDALLDTHFSIGSSSFVLALEPDQCVSIANTIIEAGANIKAIITTHKDEVLEKLECENILVGDFEDVEKYLLQSDILISNFHGERYTKKYKKALILRGFPDFEGIGNQLKNDVLYEGSCYFLFELANIINHYKFE
ncbi:nitrogenase iron-molybdenum cofactor biosynthesis protein NifN [Malaciobacter molluscorum LMG 25693]|uniref:Nitrogenase iron-molybdenum cofactor biosynthesis protein NifN n=1 Tax=Malaciobacter molluscorum LMG 25693 TaxID=870501 RepID=A0A2G1DJF8_9BACT|nr:nitrogenase iron-molybdenum cofactor biosynthesis protein NifN [Malaciobacter molluscorum]AXX93212.1 nitrogenase [Fe-Mo] cofactor synthase, NifEN complex, NifN protein [Malaciobacter molluscorum LMG 25693]PHO18466.1 nitrogenase iron-molybdenum cofactor biosynthesis protein NifN [Malaciobacter molluscorum LMG 25693]